VNINETLSAQSRLLNKQVRPFALSIRKRRMEGAKLLAFILVILTTAALHAQVNLGFTSGEVLDHSGAAIPKAQVVAENLQTGFKRAVVTDQTGIYTLAALPEGRYRVTVKSAGFATQTQSIELSAGATLGLSFHLSVGTSTQSVVVNGNPALSLETESHEVGGSIGTQQLTQLPVSGRNPLAYAAVEPGAIPGSDPSKSTSSSQFFGNTSSSIVLGGALDQQTGYLQDGVENVTLLTQTANILPSAESIENVQVITNGADARYRQPGIINITTKSGTNRFHGTAYNFLQNDALNARNYNFTATPVNNTPLRYNLFGANVGGPILRNRIFFFFDYAGLRDANTTEQLYRVPTAAELNGDFTGEQTLFDPSSYNPATRSTTSYLAETGKNALPGGSASFDPFATKFLQYFPAANIPLNTALDVNYQTPIRQTIDNDEYLGRFDLTLSGNDQAYIAFGYDANPTTDPTFVPNLFGRVYEGKATNLLMEENHVFSPTLLNSARFGYNRSNYFETIQGAGQQNWVQAFGIQNLNPLPSQWAPPNVDITNYDDVGYSYAPQGAIQNLFQFVDQVTWTVGKHVVYFGGDLMRIQFDGNWVIANNGGFDFNGTFTSQYTNGAKSTTNSGNALADFLLGYPYVATGATGISAGNFRETEIAGFIQDNWKVIPSLTLNLGLRYQFDNPPNDANGNSSIYDLPTNQTIKGTWNTNYNDWAPRVGFAYQVMPQTVIRGGFGVYYSQPPYNFLQFLLAHAPIFIPQTPAFQITNPTHTQDVFVANPSSAGQAPETLAKTMPDTNVQEFNLFAERRLGRDFVATLGYVGEVGRHESVRLNPNQPNAIAPGTNPSAYNLRPYSYIGDVLGQYNLASSNSNDLEAKLKGIFKGGSTVVAAYTWGKSMNEMDGDRNQASDYYDLRVNYAPAAWDRTNIFVLSGVYELPFGPGRRFASSGKRLSRIVYGGWQASAIWNFGSGLPVDIGATNTENTGSEGTYFAQKMCNPQAGFTRSRSEWFNKACFVQSGPFQFGIGGRSGAREPGINNFDFGLDKSFEILEGQNLQFRAEFFNLPNHPQFSLPGSTSVSSPSLGALTGTSRSMRTMQLALRYSF
jgi:hypothetical protein